MSGTAEYKNSWQKEHLDRINLTVPKGYKAEVQFHAIACGESVTSFINRAIQETMERDQRSAELIERAVKIAFNSDETIEDTKEMLQLEEAFALLKPVVSDIRKIYSIRKTAQTSRNCLVRVERRSPT